MHSISKLKAMPQERTLYNWLEEKPDFLQKYALAREARADRWADEIIEISDDSENDFIYVEDSDKNGRGARQVVNHENINRSRLRVDTRKWLMARMSPRKYGDKVQQEITGKDGGALEVAISWVAHNAKG